MADGNWKIWLVLVIAAVGTTIEVIKHLPQHESPAWVAENFHYGTDGKPYSIHDIPPSPPHPRHVAPAVKIGGDARVLEDELKKFVAATKPAASEAKDKAKKKKNDDEYEEVFDPATGKMVKRKKKKDAKKDDAKPPVAAQPVAPSVPDFQLPGNQDEAAAIAAAVNDAAKNADTPVVPAPTPNNANNPFASLQEWESRLLTHPDLAETKLFIQDYKQHTVSSDIYYKITNMMIQDSRPEMKQLGVLCAGSAPSLMSFEILVTVAKGTSANGTTQSQAQGFLNQYTTVGNLPILQNALQGGDVNSQMEAAQLVDTAAKQLLVQGQPPTSTPGAQGTTTVSANAVHFQGFLPILQNLETSSNSTLAQQARQTYTDLQSMLGGSGGAAGNLASSGMEWPAAAPDIR